MVFRLYDTRSRALVPFKPQAPGHASVYHCGPTVYSTCHIGNFRAFVFADLLRRYLEWSGYKVHQVMNITDVGHLTEDDRADAQGQDKLQKKAQELGWDPFRVARHFEQEFHADRAALGIQDAHAYPRATEHIPEMLAQIQKLVERGHAYIPEGSGEVYYDITTFGEYGALSGKDVESLQAGARVEVNQLKRHPADFALWKTDASHLMQWDPHDPELWKGSPRPACSIDPRVGKGFPGWHIECSAMAERYLGADFDLHTGGEDNVFPHHECEIAQARGAGEGQFARYWMHARHLLVDGAKMSKSAGTLYRLADIVERGFTPTELRYVLLTNHYRQPMNFTFDGLRAARASLGRLQNARNTLAQRAQGCATADASAATKERIEQFEAGFRTALDDDLNISNAMAALFSFVSDTNKLTPSPTDAKALLSALDRADHVLGVLERSDQNAGILAPEALASEAPPSAEQVSALLAADSPPSLGSVRALAVARHHARRNKDWALADQLRDHLRRVGVVLEDSPEGLRYTLPRS